MLITRPPQFTSTLDGLATYFKTLLEKGGPEPSEYASLNIYFRDIAAMVRSGNLSVAELLQLWRDLGEAFSSVRTLQGHVVAKPYGYAGDFEMMDKIYTEWISPNPKLANWDRFFHAQEATKAVRRRKQYCVELVQRLMPSTPRTETFRMLNLGCGPAREVYDLCTLKSARSVFFDCVDHDRKAIDYARELNRHFPQVTSFVCCNILRLKTNKKYDIIWAAGLFDYLNDRIFPVALRRVIRMLRSEGRLVVANFSPDNPSRDYMECGQWFVWHRTKDRLRQLAAEAGVSGSRIAVEEDPGGVVNYMQIAQR